MSRRVAVASTALGAAAALIAWGALSLARGDVLLPNLSDEALLVPLAQRAANPAAFAGDRWLDLAAEVFSWPYSYLLSGVLELIADPVQAVTALSVPFLAIFLAGTVAFTHRLAGVGAAGVALGVLLVLALAGGPVLAAGGALPRDLVFALTPLFWMGTERSEDGPAWRRAAVFLAIGIAANLHPLTAAHLAMVLVLTGVDLRRIGRQIVPTLISVAAFVVGAFPYVLQYLRLPATPGAPPESALHWRVGSIGAESLAEWVVRLEAPVLVLAAVLCALRLLRRESVAPEQEAARDRLARLVVVGVALAAVGPLVGRFIEPLRPFQFDRFGRFAYFGAVPILASAAWRVRLDPVQELRRPASWGLVAALVLAMGGPGLVRLVRSPHSPRGPLGELARAIERRLFDAPSAPSAPAALVARDGVSAPEGNVDLGAAFREVAQYARDSTNEGDVFVVPPETWSAFRAYAQRPVAVTRKDGGFALTFLGGRGADWLTEYTDAVAAYAGDDAAWARVLAVSGAKYIVIEADRPAPPVGRPVFSASPFTVYELR